MRMRSQRIYLGNRSPTTIGADMTRKVVKNSAEMVAIMCGAGIEPDQATKLRGTAKQGMAYDIAPQDCQLLLIVDPDYHTKDITFVPYASEELRLSGNYRPRYDHRWAKMKEQDRKASMRNRYDK